jgi:hypothetical protein
VTNFLAQYRPNDIRPGTDDGKVGQVFVIDTARELLTDTIILDPMVDTGGSALKKLAVLLVTLAHFGVLLFVTFLYQWQQIVLKIPNP